MSAARQQVQEYLGRFDRLIQGFAARHKVEELAHQVYVLHPQNSTGEAVGLPKGKDIILSLTALIHGVEVAGLAVLVELLELVTRGEIQLEFPLGLALGNVPAALQGARFLERDLNRSFGRSESSLLEEKRADELERLLTRSACLLDIHQVKLTIDRPFWIFPYTPGGYSFARTVGPEVSLITHWGRGFSSDGQCSDEWVNRQGGCGVTVELGQNGFDPKQIENGLGLCRRAIDLRTQVAKGRLAQTPHQSHFAPLYTWGEIIPYPPTGKPVLYPGWHNFRMVKAGEAIGIFDGNEIKAQVSGPVLFPKYPDARPDGTYGDAPPAAELIRILKEIAENDLPAR